MIYAEGTVIWPPPEDSVVSPTEPTTTLEPEPKDEFAFLESLNKIDEILEEEVTE